VTSLYIVSDHNKQRATLKATYPSRVGGGIVSASEVGRSEMGVERSATSRNGGVGARERAYLTP
jgi:hypothetical protein